MLYFAVKWDPISLIWRLIFLCVTGQDSDDTRSEENLSLMPKSKKTAQFFSDVELLKILVLLLLLRPRNKIQYVTNCPLKHRVCKC